MYRLCLVFWAAVVVTAQYDGEQRGGGGGGLLGYPGKPLLGPLYSSFSGSQGFRDTSYEDNAVTPTPSPTPIYRNPSNSQVNNFYLKIFNIKTYSLLILIFCFRDSENQHHLQMRIYTQNHNVVQ